MKTSSPGLKNAPSFSTSRAMSDIFALEAIIKAHGDKNGVERLQRKRKDLDDPSVLVFVIGEGNFGKSSLINHILNRPVAAVSHLPKTWRIDLYRHSPDGREYAELRRSNVAGTQRLPIKDALAECVTQEAQVFKDVRESKDTGSDAATSFDGQIIEVNWYYTNLATPKNVVLVDTPGFLQALGRNRQRVETISSNKGVVFADLNAAYEYYYPRANVVLWAFRADRINDRDTEETFQTLAEQKKDILGIVTFFDLMKTEQERLEALRRAEKLFGPHVVDLLPVITGGKTPSLGHGIPEVREQLEHVSNQAAVIKLEEAAQFILNEAASCQRWMVQKGDLLIANVTQISFYCNATSGGLLREAKTSHEALVQHFQNTIAPQVAKTDFSAFVRTTLEEASKVPALLAARTEGRQPTSEDKAKMVKYFNENVTDKLRISDLNRQFHNRLKYISGYIVAEGKRQSAGHHLAQIIIHQSGETKKYKLESQINPPDVATLSVAFPAPPVPVIFSSGIDELLDFIGSRSGFAGGVLRIFGWQSKAEENERLMLSAIADTKHSAQALPSQMKKALSQYVVQAAQAVVRSADEAAKEVYPGKNLLSLKDDAVEIDKHLDQLQTLLKANSVQDENRYLYKTLYALWSPRDDPRRAVIDTFCEWFDRKQAELSRECCGWLAEVLTESPFNKPELSHIVQAHLVRTKQTQEVIRPMLASGILKTSDTTDIVHLWSTRLAQRLVKKQLFNDRKNFLKIKFDGFELQGIANEFSKVLGSEFKRRFDRHFASLTISGNRYPMPEFNNSKVYGIKPLAGVLGVATFSALGCGTVEYFAGVKIWQHIADSFVAAGAAGAFRLAGNWGYQLKAFRQRRQEAMVASVTSEICEKLVESAHSAWQETYPLANSQLARQLIGQRTLVKKRALDFATEGEFMNADF